MDKKLKHKLNLRTNTKTIFYLICGSLTDKYLPQNSLIIHFGIYLSLPFHHIDISSGNDGMDDMDIKWILSLPLGSVSYSYDKD